MSDPSRRFWRPFFLILALLALSCQSLRAYQNSGPATTVIHDVIYRGNGAPAQGTLLISWPAFVTGDRKAVTAGSMSIAIGAGGSLNLALVPNEGATPAGTYYKVLLKLDDGTTTTEFWSVPSTSPTTVSAVRTTVIPTSTSTSQFATTQYVDTQVATRLARQLDVPVNLGAIRYASQFATIQAAITDAGANGSVLIPSSYSGTDSYTNSNNVPVLDLRNHRLTVSDIATRGPQLDARAYGAVCDGATDDSAAIQSALNDASVSRRNVIVPGRCRVNTGILARNNHPLAGAMNPIEIKCLGSSSGFFWGGAAGGTILSLGDPTGAQRDWPISVINCGFDSVDDAHRAGIALYTNNIGDGKLEHLWLGNVTDGIVLDNITLLYHLDGIQAAGVWRDAIRLQNQSIGNWIEHGEFLQCGRYCINATSASAEGRIRDNDFEGTIAGSLAAIHLGHVSGWSVAANRFEDELGVGGPSFRDVVLDNTASASFFGNRYGAGAGAGGATAFVTYDGAASSGEHFGEDIANYPDGGGALIELNNGAGPVTWHGGQNCVSNLIYTGPSAFRGALDYSCNDGTLLNTNFIKVLQPGAPGNNKGTALFHLNSKNIMAASSTETLPFPQPNPAPANPVPGDIVLNRTWSYDNHYDNNLGWVYSTTYSLWLPWGTVWIRPIYETVASTPPTANFLQGMVVKKVLPDAGTFWAWVCTASGNPCTYNAVAPIAEDAGGRQWFLPRLRHAVTAVTFSATPSFDASAADDFTITLTADVTSSTLANAGAGQEISFQVCQDGAGGHAFAWPSNLKGAMTIGATANKCSVQTFKSFDGTSAYATTAGVANQ